MNYGMASTEGGWLTGHCLQKEKEEAVREKDVLIIFS